MLGLTPILDFDGTITELPVDWSSLRRQLGIHQIVDLWERDISSWTSVTEAEVAAAMISEPIRPIFDELSKIQRFAVVSSNSTICVRTFFDRFPAVGRRVGLIIGRDELGGPKTDFHRFARAVRQCAAALEYRGARGALTYVGNEAYELEFARRLGLRAVDAHQFFDTSDRSTGDETVGAPS
jgi:hypothetical protein